MCFERENGFWSIYNPPSAPPSPLTLNNGMLKETTVPTPPQPMAIWSSSFSSFRLDNHGQQVEEHQVILFIS